MPPPAVIETRSRAGNAPWIALPRAGRLRLVAIGVPGVLFRVRTR